MSESTVHRHFRAVSQFSREYRRLFGGPPGRDAQRIRAADGVPVP